MKLQKKLQASKLALYHRCVYENHKIECVEVLKDWIIQEAKFQVKALETVQGVLVLVIAWVAVKFGINTTSVVLEMGINFMRRSQVKFTISNTTRVLYWKWG